MQSPVAQNYEVNTHVGQNYQVAGPLPKYPYPAQYPPRPTRSGHQGPNRYDDGNSAMERVGNPGYVGQMPEGPLGPRLGQRQLPAHNARNKLDSLHLSEYLEEQGPPGPRCFGPRIMYEPPPTPGFQMPRGSKSYDGSTKPQDWLADYVAAVYVARGNRRWAVRHIPQMLEGPTRI